MIRMTKEEMKECRRLLKPENKEELDSLIKECIKGPGHPLIEKFAFETLAKTRACQKTLDGLRKQLEEEENE